MASDNPYLDHYDEQRAHQREHSPTLGALDGRPHDVCIECLKERRLSADEQTPHATKKHYAWAIPDDVALEAIAKHSPHGVVEIGAGAGYWAKLLRARGVDVVAYDPAPGDGDSQWHVGESWSPVLVGDHQAVTAHPDRTLLLVWPSYELDWTHEVVALYGGSTIVYVGEGGGGCTGTDEMHERLERDFDEVDAVAIPTWFGLHDRLTVHRRSQRADDAQHGEDNEHDQGQHEQPTE